ncbi:MAG: RHS repeat-associated core domain-containing protein [Candidatus Methylomirabilales bacterium]
MPVPFELRYDAGNRVGEGGLGWSIPFSYVVRTDSFTRQRPKFAIDPNDPPEPNSRVFLVLNGSPILMIAIDHDATRYRPMVNSQNLLLSLGGDGEWRLQDGRGFEYLFQRLEILGFESMWFLTEINDTTGKNPVRLFYNFGEAPRDKRLKLLYLDVIRYNYHPTGYCAKHEINFKYETWDSSESGERILGLSVQNGRVLARTKVLQRIDIKAMGNSCDLSDQKRLSSYELKYKSDTDTLQPRLAAVDFFGQEGTPEETKAIPVARYSYGAARAPGGELLYFETTPITVPQETITSGVGTVLSSMIEESDNRYSTRHVLQDFTGDGLPDLVFPKGSFESTEVWIAPNVTDFGGTSFSGSTPHPLLPAGLDSLSEQKTSTRRFRYGLGMYTEDTWVQVIDFNADGRLDVLDAREKGHWKLYLNVPGSSGDPNEIDWQEKRIKTLSIRNYLAEKGLWKASDKKLPFARSKIGRDVDIDFCWRYVGVSPFAFNFDLAQASKPANWVQCDPETLPDTQPFVVRAHAEKTRTEWKLADVNGDGFPDLVTNSLPIENSNNLKANFKGCWVEFLVSVIQGPYFDVEVEPIYTHCSRYNRVGFPLDESGGGLKEGGNRLYVHYNKAGVNLRDDNNKPFTPPHLLSWEGYGAAEEWTAPIAAPTGIPDLTKPLPIGPVRNMTYGLVDVNGDGLLDRTRSNPLKPWENYWYIGTGQGFFPVRFELRGYPASVTSGRDEVCSQENSNADDEYEIKRTQGLVDLSGDGIPDYVSFNKVYIGTGAGWSEDSPINIQTPPYLDFSLSSTRETCEGSLSWTESGLFDVNGDGRPEFVSAIAGHFSVARLINAAGNFGAHEAGRIKKIENGYGAATLIEYTSAKNDSSQRLHQVPFSEIVVSKIATIVTTSDAGEGSLEPFYFAYGDAYLRYHAGVDGWVFPGYGRKVTLRGLPYLGASSSVARGRPSFRLKGTASIVDTITLEDHPTGYDSYALVGRTKDIHSLYGIFGFDPWELLDLDVQGTSRWHGQVHYNYKTRRFSQEPQPALDCTNFPSPYDLPGPIFFVFDGVLDWPCRSTGLGYPATVTSWQGDKAPPSDENIETRTQTLAIDEFGRPLLLYHQNDTHFDGDDVCEEFVYAENVDDFHILNAAHSWKLYECGTIDYKQGGPTLARRRYQYDNLPEGKVAQGFLTQVIVERYNTSTHEKLDEFKQSATSYDVFGKVNKISSVRNDGVSRLDTFGEYDPFHLIPTGSTATASDVTTSLHASVEIDPWTLAPLSGTHENGTVLKFYDDGFGRVVLETVIVPSSEQEWVLRKVGYVGDAGDDPDGRHIRGLQFHSKLSLEEFEANPNASLGKTTESITYFDEFGRPRFSVSPLGDDYGEEIIVTGDVKYDTLGRVVFLADPYLGSESGDTLYGTTYFYRPDNTIHFTIRGRGVQPFSEPFNSSPTTSENQARFVTRVDRVYGFHRVRFRVFGPNELLDGSTQKEAYHQTTQTGNGWTLENSRWQNNSQLELSEYKYDRLGQLAAVRRFQEPLIASGGVEWLLQYDSLGQLLLIEEPAAAPRNHSYDIWGNLVNTRWDDTGNTRELVYEYDGFSRILRKAELENGVVEPNTETRFAYDEPSGDEDHLFPEFLKGRLSHATSFAENGTPRSRVFFGYDALGQIRAVSRVGVDGERYAEIYKYRLDGQLDTLTFRLPGTGQQLETIAYHYDSAMRVEGITWSDQVGIENLFTALEIHPFGRYRRVRLGNGVRENFTYKGGDRRELVGKTVFGDSWTHVTNFLDYDGEMRVRRLQVQTSMAENEPETTLYSYDPLNRLARAQTKVGTNFVRDEEFEYDGLGNLTKIIDHFGAGDISISTHPVDRDRICDITGGTLPLESEVSPVVGQLALGPPVCDYTYDVLGNVLRIVEGQSVRTLNYDGWSRVRSITSASVSASYRYGPQGDVTELDVADAKPGGDRHNRRYGALVEKSTFTFVEEDSGEEKTISFVERRVPGPMGILMARRGLGEDATVLYWHGDSMANRFFTDAGGEIVQEVKYRPFGGILEDTGSEDGSNSTKYLWNSGDYLKAFQLFHLGARLFDPTIGRFLQREPIVVPRSASKTHPYAFAWNDPVNFADPSGMDPLDPEPWTANGACWAPEQCSFGSFSFLVNADLRGDTFGQLLGQGDVGPSNAPDLSGLSKKDRPPIDPLPGSKIGRWVSIADWSVGVGSEALETQALRKGFAKLGETFPKLSPPFRRPFIPDTVPESLWSLPRPGESNAAWLKRVNSGPSVTPNWIKHGGVYLGVASLGFDVYSLTGAIQEGDVAGIAVGAADVAGDLAGAYGLTSLAGAGFAGSAAAVYGSGRLGWEIGSYADRKFGLSDSISDGLYSVDPFFLRHTYSDFSRTYSAAKWRELEVLRYGANVHAWRRAVQQGESSYYPPEW